MYLHVQLQNYSGTPQISSHLNRPLHLIIDLNS